MDILEDSNEIQYCLTRRRPVIFRARNRKRSSHGNNFSSKMYEQSMVSNKAEEFPGEHFDGSSPLLLKNIHGLQSVSNTPKQLHNVSPKANTSRGSPSDAYCSLEFVMEKTLPSESSKSWSSSYEEINVLNSEALRLETGITISSDTHLISRPSALIDMEWGEQVKEEFYRKSVDLDQENDHFVVVDMVLEVLEAAKWRISQKYSDCSSLDSGYEECSYHSFPSSTSSQSLVNRCSAEALAQKLFELGRWWIYSEELLGKFPLATNSMVTDWEASLNKEIRQRSRMRGTFIWSPPQFQIIFSLQPTRRRSCTVASQNFLCAGCGTEVDSRYMKRLRYCDYLGKYFCNGCHSGGESMIPARVLNLWDFGRYPVCQFSKQLLDSIWEKPLFKIMTVANNLYSQAKELQKFKELQEQITSIKKLLTACRLSDGVLAEFQQLPSHLSQELHLFSMDDLVRIKKGTLITRAKVVMRSAAAHVEECELCQAKGFICEVCRGPDVLFPFQTDICTRCQDCRTCFHIKCFQDEPCPKCIRHQSRQNVQ